MSCFPCFGSKKTEEDQVPEQVPVAQVAPDTSASPARPPPPAAAVNKPRNLSAEEIRNEPQTTESNGSRTFTFRELAMATKNFKQESLIGEGGFGKLYKGKLISGEVVAVKQLDRNGTQGSKEFLDEVLILTRLDHPNLVKLIGYCADGDQRLLVYEYISFGSLDVHLHGEDHSADKKPLDWQTRMKIASGVAQGLEYLHEKANPPILYHTLKPANVLLNEDFDPRLSGYGLAKLANGDTKMHATPRVMGTYGYCAPEYERQGELTMKSDVYSFGVILLEIITGRKALDTTKPTDEQNLVTWAQPIFKDQKKFIDLADPNLEGRFPQKSLNQAVGIAAMCLQEEPSIRPLMGDVLSILNFLAVATPEEASAPAAALASENNGKENEGGDSSSSSSSDDDSDDDSENDDADHAENHKDKSNSSKKRNSLRSKSGGSSHSSSRSYDDNVFQDENEHQNSADQHQNGSINSSIGNGRYEDSFAWSIGSSNYQHHDGGARQNSGHMSMRQQSISNT